MNLSTVNRDRAEFDPETQLHLYEALDAFALALGAEATEVMMAVTGTVVVSHGTIDVAVHDPDLATAARKVVLRWLTAQGITSDRTIVVPTR